MAQKIASKLKINGIQYKLKDDNAVTEQEVANLIQQGTSSYVTQEQLTNTIGDINALLDTINGEQI